MGAVNLFYLSKNTTGGWVTFTRHLVSSLMAVGEQPMLFKIGNRDEGKPRDFGYGLRYTNVTAETAAKLAGQSPTIIVALAKQLKEPGLALLAAGARIVIHDPTEVRSWLPRESIKAPWVIRMANEARFDGARFIRHPYQRLGETFHLHEKLYALKTTRCVSVSRIDFDKHTEILLDANRLGAGIVIRGFENRIYTRFKILPAYPEWKQSVAAYPRNVAEAFKILFNARYMADMSLIKGDGGGTQYTFLEAWDALCVPIIHEGWIRPEDDMRDGYNCLTVGTGGELAVGLKELDGEGYRPWAELVENGEQSLKLHHPKIIGRQVMEWLHG